MTLRVLLDVNVLITNVLSRRTDRSGTTSQKLVDWLAEGRLGGLPAQLVISHAMLGSVASVLSRLLVEQDIIDDAVAALVQLSVTGPDLLDPYLLLGGTAAQALADREDAAVLATAFAARADLLVTDNLDDFADKDCRIVPSIRVRHSDGEPRRLHRQLHRAPSGHVVTVVHPLELVMRLARGQSPIFDDVTRG